MISGFHVEQLLRLKLLIDKGEAISNAICYICARVGDSSLVRPMCFDTTASNIGRQIAACDDRK